MTLSLREQRQTRILRKRLDQLRLRDLAAWGEYQAFCDAYRDGALSQGEYVLREPGEWRRLRVALNEHASMRRVLVVELGDLVEVAESPRYVDDLGTRA